MPHITEQDVQDEIISYLDKMRILYWVIDVKRMRPPDRRLSGFPDIHGIIPNTNGKAFYIEVKAPKAKPKPHEVKQREVHSKIRNANGLMIEADCLQDVKYFLDFHLKAFEGII